MRTCSGDRRGLCNANALAVVALFLLAGLLVPPALCQVLGAGDRIACQNNLKQLSLAVLSYDNDFGQLPSVGKGAADNTKTGTGSWCFALLPYVEQVNVYRANGGKNAVRLYYSPTRRKGALYNDLPKSDYAGNAGTADDPEKPSDDGVFTTNGIRITDIQDGASNTLIFGVKGLKTGDYTTGKGAGDNGSCWTGGTVDTLRTSNGGNRVPVKDGNTDNARGFGSPLDGSCNFVMADRSIRGVKLNVKPAVFKALTTRAGGEVVNQADF